MGIGIVYWIPIMCSWEWFPNHKGLVSGLVVAGFGFSAFIFGFVTTAIANPNNFGPDLPLTGGTDKLMPQSVGERVPAMLRYCLIAWVVLGILAILGISRNPEFVREEKEEEERYSSEFEEPKTIVNYISSREAMRSIRFWHLGSLMFCGIFYGVYMASVYKIIAQNELNDF